MTFLRFEIDLQDYFATSNVSNRLPLVARRSAVPCACRTARNCRGTNGAMRTRPLVLRAISDPIFVFLYVDAIESATHFALIQCQSTNIDRFISTRTSPVSAKLIYTFIDGRRLCRTCLVNKVYWSNKRKRQVMRSRARLLPSGANRRLSLFFSEFNFRPSE